MFPTLPLVVGGQTAILPPGGPVLGYDFTGGSLDPVVGAISLAFARAEEASYRDVNDLKLKWAPSGSARFTRGLLVEGEAVQLLQQTENLAAAPWTGSATVAGTTMPTPEGDSGANGFFQRITDSSSSESQTRAQVFQLPTTVVSVNDGNGLDQAYEPDLEDGDYDYQQTLLVVSGWMAKDTDTGSRTHLPLITVDYPTDDDGHYLKHTFTFDHRLGYFPAMLLFFRESSDFDKFTDSVNWSLVEDWGSSWRFMFLVSLSLRPNGQGRILIHPSGANMSGESSDSGKGFIDVWGINVQAISNVIRDAADTDNAYTQLAMSSSYIRCTTARKRRPADQVYADVSPLSLVSASLYASQIMDPQFGGAAKLDKVAGTVASIGDGGLTGTSDWSTFAAVKIGWSVIFSKQIGEVRGSYSIFNPREVNGTPARETTVNNDFGCSIFGGGAPAPLSAASGAGGAKLITAVGYDVATIVRFSVNGAGAASIPGSDAASAVALTTLVVGNLTNQLSVGNAAAPGTGDSADPLWGVIGAVFLYDTMLDDATLRLASAFGL